MPDVRQIEQLRPSKNPVVPGRPVSFIHEAEPGPDGNLRGVNTIFLTNKECPFRCLMCDLWKNTLDGPTPRGAILQQLDYALERLPEAPVIKLYNSGNFFDRKAVPPEEYPDIAERLRDYEKVIVENHPSLCGDACLVFNDLLGGKLEIALGLETIHPEVLPRLNKQMTPEDYRKAAEFLSANHIAIRTFILLNPPFLTDKRESIAWTLRTVQFAFDAGSQSCTIIPTRAGNGIMELLEKNGQFEEPGLHALETAFDQALEQTEGIVFADLWDLERFSRCAHCFGARKERLEAMNAGQEVLPSIVCSCDDGR